MYTVTADVNSDKFGKGTLEAQLNETEFIEYANLSDKDKLQFLKDKGAEFRVDVVKELTDEDVTNFNIDHAAEGTAGSSPQVTRKMRMNINGKDTGWVDVNEENETQYNEMMEYFNNMQEQFNERFQNFFSRTPGSLLDFPSPFRIGNKEENEDQADK